MNLLYSLLIQKCEPKADAESAYVIFLTQQILHFVCSAFKKIYIFLLETNIDFIDLHMFLYDYDSKLNI